MKGRIFEAGHTTAPDHMLKRRQNPLASEGASTHDVHAARADEQHARMLARELSHRVKNMFSVISAVVALSARQERATHVADRINDRIRALGRAYDATLDHAHLRRVILSDVVQMVLEPYAAAGRDRLRISGPEVILDPNAVSTVGLTLHELATIAVTEGALSSAEGRVSVTWSLQDHDGSSGLLLFWEEQGGATHSKPAKIREFGSGIVDMLIRSTGGDIRFEPTSGGLRSILRLPVSSGEEREASKEAEHRWGDDGLSGRTILVVEDEGLIALELQAALEDAGSAVQLAFNEHDALRLLSERLPDAAVLDVNLGRNTTCAEIARRLRNSGTPFVLHSGDLRRHGELIDTLAAPVIAKPASSAEIRKALLTEIHRCAATPGRGQPG